MLRHHTPLDYPGTRSTAGLGFRVRAPHLPDSSGPDQRNAHGTAISRPPCLSDTLSLHSSPLDGGSVLALGGGSVSFAQIVKACEPVFAAVIALVIPPVEVKPALAYMMLLVIVGGVGLACVKEGKGVEINM